LGLLDIDSYFLQSVSSLGWPRRTYAHEPGASAIADELGSGCPQMTWGRTLENALKRKGISEEFDEWFAIAKDRSKWRQLAHSNPKPPDA